MAFLSLKPNLSFKTYLRSHISLPLNHSSSPQQHMISLTKSHHQLIYSSCVIFITTHAHRDTQPALFPSIEQSGPVLQFVSLNWGGKSPTRAQQMAEDLGWGQGRRCGSALCVHKVELLLDAPAGRASSLLLLTKQSYHSPTVCPCLSLSLAPSQPTLQWRRQINHLINGLLDCIFDQKHILKLLTWA